MQVYFSHSYRDTAVNSYFIEHFVREEIDVDADQKSDIWCVAKLERAVNDADGFIGIIPRRATDQDSAAYSAYIGHELSLARRARVPRLLFVDELVLERHRLDFPEDAVLFRPETPAADQACHGDAIREFRKALDRRRRPTKTSRQKEASVVVGEGLVSRGIAADVSEILRRADYAVTMLSGRRPERGLNDIRLLETLWRAELNVFLLGERLSEAHIALAMAHAHCIPSIRLQQDRRSTDCSPGLTGVIRWAHETEMLVEFSRQIQSYEDGLIQLIERARDTTALEAATSSSRMKWQKDKDQYWDVRDGLRLVRHLHPDHSFVADEIDRVSAQFNRSLGLISGREDTMELCRSIYEGVRRHRFVYEVQQLLEGGRQAIRTPNNIRSHKTATCLDLACLFASLLVAAGQCPVIVVLEWPGHAHALAGYRVRNEPSWECRTIGDLRGALARRDAVLFEGTGAVEAEAPVGSEEASERVEKRLGFPDALAAAWRMVGRQDVQLTHFVDVQAVRERA